MKNEAQFSVVIPEGALDESMKPSFEDMCQRYGIPLSLPLKADSKGRYVIASNLSLAEAQQIRRQISGAGYAVDIQSISEQIEAEEDDISSIAIALDSVDPDTLVVEGGLLDSIKHDDISDIMDDAWDSLEFPAPDADIDDDISLPGDSQLGANKDSTLSLTAKQLLNAVLAADKVEKAEPKKNASSLGLSKLGDKRTDMSSELGSSGLGMGQLGSAGNAGNSSSTRIVRQTSGTRKAISLGDSKNGSSRLGNSGFGKRADASNTAATPAAPLNAVSSHFQMKAVNQLIPPSSISFEVSDVNEAVEPEVKEEEDQLIDVSGEMDAAVEDNSSGLPINTPTATAAAASAEECSRKTQALAVPRELINCEQTHVRKISTDANKKVVFAENAQAIADNDLSSEETVVRSRPHIEVIKPQTETNSQPEPEKLDFSQLKGSGKASSSKKQSKFVEPEPDPAAVNFRNEENTGVSTWILAALLACAAILVVLTLIDLFVSPIPFIESLAAPF